ncbi:MAG TPA: hypothetical protein PKK86_07250, partial [Candidatus Syntrophosphaera sp.]|nr:hypothetical protein [Candidatus Syntrophosphaera sp.]
ATPWPPCQEKVAPLQEVFFFRLYGLAPTQISALPAQTASGSFSASRNKSAMKKVEKSRGQEG